MSKTKYIHFTDEEKRWAASVDLVDFLTRRGERLITSGHEKRLARDRSITVRGNKWYDHAEERGGQAVSLIQRLYDLDYPQAMLLLLGRDGAEPIPYYEPQKEKPPQPFALPSQHKDMRRLYAYLCSKRGIDREIITHFVRAGMLYEDEKYHNAVFVGFDEGGVARHAHKRSTNSYGEPFRINIESSDPHYSFHHIGSSGNLFVFEAPIDMLSFITLHPRDWQTHSYVACCGTTMKPLLKMLQLAPTADSIYLCLDNDDAGHKAAARMQSQLCAQYGERYAIGRLVPAHKDWNDDLIMSKEVQEQCPTLQM